MVIIKSLFNKIYFKLFTFESFVKSPFNESYYLEFSSVLFSLFLLIGVLIYYVSNEKEKRILRMSLILFFIALLFRVVFMPFYLFTSDEPINAGFSIFLVTNFAYLFFGYKTLIYLGKEKTFIPVEKKEKNEIQTEEKTYQSAREQLNRKEIIKDENLPFLKANWKLRLINLCLDTFFCILIASTFIFSVRNNDFISKLVKSISEIFGDSNAFIIVMLFFRLIYYVVCETLFKTTPAKALTETQVYALNDKKLTVDVVLVRTFSRFIPFEAFSFFGKNGWHDLLSDTAVLKNKTFGFAGIYSFLLLHIFILIPILNAWFFSSF